MSNVRRLSLFLSASEIEMHLYLRLLKPVLSYTEEEKAGVAAVVSAAPGVERVKLVERHVKGGYAVTVDVARESLDSLIEYLPANGLQSVF
jgi:predicted transcriptional regulator